VKGSIEPRLGTRKLLPVSDRIPPSSPMDTLSVFLVEPLLAFAPKHQYLQTNRA